MPWVEDPQEKRVFWINRLAGTGKSTIAQTFSEMVARNGALGVSFFYSRDYLGRKELKNIFPHLRIGSLHEVQLTSVGYLLYIPVWLGSL